MSDLNNKWCFTAAHIYKRLQIGDYSRAHDILLQMTNADHSVVKRYVSSMFIKDMQQLRDIPYMQNKLQMIYQDFLLMMDAEFSRKHRLEAIGKLEGYPRHQAWASALGVDPLDYHEWLATTNVVDTLQFQVR